MPAGVTDGPETVAVAVTVWPYTGDAGRKLSAIVDAGGVAGPVSVSCTAGGVDKAALARFPLKVAVSVVVTKVVGVYVAVNAQTPPVARVEGKAPLSVQSVEAEAVRL